MNFQKTTRRLLFLMGCLSLTPTLALAQRDLTNIPLPDPELERQTFVLPEGFEVNLFAADPQIAKPIQMNFDPAGRLWLVSSSTYPQIVPGEQADDKVLVLEDTDGDGVSDRTQVFAGGLLIPTGIEPGDGGAYVAASTELLHLADTDGDGKADERRIVLSGFGTEDTHHLIHAFRWGPEQRLYINQSIYIHSHVETPWGVERLNAGGIWQFRPENVRLDVLARGWVNAWGIDFDAYGQTFVTDGAGGEGINFVVPGASYTTAYGAQRILAGLNPGSPKHCGLEIVSGRHLPDDWQGNFITCDFRGHRVCRFVVTEQGSGFRSQEQTELIKSDHVAFRPIDVKMGPDGAIYIADWYNPIIQHGEVDFRDPRRDHTHGRIWRVSVANRPLVDRPQLVGASTEDLLEQLTAPEIWTRQQTRRLLNERGLDILPALKQWARNLDNSTPEYHRHRLEALWVYQGLDVIDPELLDSLLRCSDHRVRAGATRVLNDWYDKLSNSLALLEVLVGDEHPRVRMEAVRVLSRLQPPEAIEVALRALDPSVHPASASDDWQTDDPAKIREADPVEVDEWLDYALWLTARELQPIWEPALLSGEIDFGGRTDHLVFALRSAGSATTVPVLTRLLREGHVAEEHRDDVLDVIAEFGGPHELQEVLELAAAATDPTIQVASLRRLLTAHTRRKVQPAGDHAGLDRLLTSSEAPVRAEAARCAGAWHVERMRDAVRSLAQDRAENIAIRKAAIEGVALFGDASAAELLQDDSWASEPVDVRLAVASALLRLRPQAAVQSAVVLMQDANALGQIEPLLQSILSRKDAAGLLSEALQGTTLSADAGVLALRAVRSSGQPFPELSAALEKAAGITTGPMTLTVDEMAELVRAVEGQGDPVNGERLYRRADLSCVKCHAIGGAGGQVGPDLVSLGASAQIDYLIDALLDPNKQVKENFHTMIVLTDSGETISGIVVRQSDDELILRDAEARELHVPLKSVELMNQGVSLMPAGLTDKLTRAELIDLTAFLKALGRVPAFTIGTTRVVRDWEVLQPTEQAAYQLRRVSYAAAASDDPAFQWRRVFSTVGGALPLDELEQVDVRNRSAAGTRGVAFARFRVESPADGAPIAVTFDNIDGLTAWWGDEPVTLQPVTSLQMQRGENRLTIAVDLNVRTADLRVATNAPGTSAE